MPKRKVQKRPQKRSGAGPMLKSLPKKPSMPVLEIIPAGIKKIPTRKPGASYHTVKSQTRNLLITGLKSGRAPVQERRPRRRRKPLK